MKKMIDWIRSHPARFYFFIFLLMIVPALALYSIAQREAHAAMYFSLFLIIFSNLVILFY